MEKHNQRIAIAKVCGWKWVQGCLIPGDELLIWNKPWEPSQATCGFTIPDYCNDLNAMHEAEKVLNQSKYSDYICQLYYKKMGLGGGICDWQKLASATAEQRAEAFLRTFDKWEEGK